MSYERDFGDEDLEDAPRNDTEHLLSSPANAAALRESIAQLDAMRPAQTTPGSEQRERIARLVHRWAVLDANEERAECEGRALREPSASKIESFWKLAKQDRYCSRADDILAALAPAEQDAPPGCCPLCSGTWVAVSGYRCTGCGEYTETAKQSNRNTDALIAALPADPTVRGGTEP